MLGPRGTAPEARQDVTETPEAGQSWSDAYVPDKDSEAVDANPWTDVYGVPPEAVTRRRLEELRSAPWRR